MHAKIFRLIKVLIDWFTKILKLETCVFTQKNQPRSLSSYFINDFVLELSTNAFLISSHTISNQKKVSNHHWPIKKTFTTSTQWKKNVFLSKLAFSMCDIYSFFYGVSIVSEIIISLSIRKHNEGVYIQIQAKAYYHR